jgi:hypothetical protein
MVPQEPERFVLIGYPDVHIDPDHDELIISGQCTIAGSTWTEVAENGETLTFGHDDPVVLDVLRVAWQGGEIFYGHIVPCVINGEYYPGYCSVIKRSCLQAIIDRLEPDPVYGIAYNAERLRELGFRVPEAKG